MFIVHHFTICGVSGSPDGSVGKHQRCVQVLNCVVLCATCVCLSKDALHKVFKLQVCCIYLTFHAMCRRMPFFANCCLFLLVHIQVCLKGSPRNDFYSDKWPKCGWVGYLSIILGKKAIFFTLKIQNLRNCMGWGFSGGFFWGLP